MLDVEGLSVDLAVPGVDLPGGGLRVLHDVCFRLARGERLGVVGESGSGKTMLALALLGLLPEGGRAGGRVLLEGEDLLRLDEAALCRVRGGRIGMVFQEPLTALNPAMKVGRQIAEGLMLHRGLGRRAARAETLRLLDRVRIPDAARRIDSYPHELSGGQRQRVGIAVALAPKPALLIADEPTTALDVTVQAEILALLNELVGENGMGLILISHDLGVIAAMTDRTLVLYAGTRVEEGPTATLLRRPAHPYTRGLLAALPRRTGGGRLATIPGSVPPLSALPPGCRFAPRCPLVVADCLPAEPAWRSLGDGGARCIRAGEAVP